MIDVGKAVTEVSLVGAVNLALKRAMADDPAVLVLGEDVGVDGGVFRATDGLLALFGKNRVLDTPLAEAGISGASIGLAAQGLRPVAEIQFSGFAYACIDQVLNHAGRLRARTRGRLTCPMVLRAPAGGGIKAPEHHSESPEAIFAHIPGLKVAIPSSPVRAYGLLLSAIRDPDPVLFLEPTRLYRAAREKVADDGIGMPLEQCFVLRQGRDVTLVSWGAMIAETLGAAANLANENIEAEVIDVGTLKPLDTATILTSVARTGRLVIVHEAPITCGYGAEIAARVASRALTSLLAPIERVAGFDTMMPYLRRESFYMPNVEQVAATVRRTMTYA
jgi:2-oxoisovalerate dehydrogenase E1 component beta subunit